jgi:hypothetical protein
VDDIPHAFRFGGRVDGEDETVSELRLQRHGIVKRQESPGSLEDGDLVT